MVLVIIGSSDRKVSLHNIFGTQIGVFGQPDLWKIKLATKLKQFNQEISEMKNQKNLVVFNTEQIKNNILKSDDFKPIESESGPIKKESTEINKKLILEKEIFDSSGENYFDIPGFTTSADFGLVKKLNARLNLEESFNYDKEAFIKNPNLRYNPWSKTLLGNVYFFFFSIFSIRNCLNRLKLLS